VAVLRQLAELIDRLSDEQYRTGPAGLVSGSVGGHVRHCLDHVESLLGGLDTGLVDYDRRRRGTDVEASRQAALDAVRRQERHLLTLPAVSWQRPLRLSVLLSGSRPPVLAETSLGRELAFVLSHTIHHNALIAVLARALGVSPPEHFGYAPSTIAHLEKAACAR
jgi:uncharacterized damage-inducible protein DinB